MAHRIAAILILFSIVFVPAIRADIVSDAGTQTYSIHRSAQSGGLGPIPTTEFYGSGPDDNFSEYGVTTFNFGGDFNGVVTAINSVQLDLTTNDRFFSDGSIVEFFFTPDTGADLDNGGGDFSGLFYDPSAVNGISAAQYNTAPVSLGRFNIPEMAGRSGGEVDQFNLSFLFSTPQLIAAINTGADFQILIGAVNAADDVTYSGVGNTFDPGDPQLTIDAVVNVVPEPGTSLVLAGIGLACVLRRRNR